MTLLRVLALTVLALAPLALPAAEFRSVAENGTIFYDAPSAKARRVYAASRHLPVEIVVNLEAWAKVRDSAGDLAWVEKKALGETRFVIVTAPLADVRQSPDASASMVFQAQTQVVLELVETVDGGWARVKHRDGQTGFVKGSQVWGL